MEIVCPYCAAQLKCPDDWRGTTAECPDCGKEIALPKARPRLASVPKAAPPTDARPAASDPAPAPLPPLSGQQKAEVRWWLWAAVLVLVVCAAIWEVSDNWAYLVREYGPRIPPPPPAPAVAAPRLVYTYEQYQAITMNMPMTSVLGVLHHEGVEQASDKLGQQWYQWRDDEGHVISLWFQHGCVVNRQQFGW